ncbi:MAG: hypothetical protein HYX34_03225 [Actinobacteria bacterium]|nr:hypothetical protein [Actinomycetota bacterium]
MRRWSHHPPGGPVETAVRRAPAPLRRCDQRGVAGGFEALPFGVLIFVIGSLLVLNGWAVVDGKLTASAAAREAARAYVEAPSAAAGRGAARSAAEEVVRNMRRDPARLRLGLPDDSAFFRCNAVTVDADLRVATIRLPVIGGTGGTYVVHGRQTEIVDPLRSGLEVERRACY